MRNPFFNYHDSRGERLERYEIAEEEPGNYTVFLDGPDEAAQHVRLCADGRYTEVAAAPGSGFTHAIDIVGRPTPATYDFLNLLTGVVAVPAPPGVDLAVALDFYKAPNEDGEMVDTEMGECIHFTKHAKYPTGSNSRRAWRKLLDAMSGFIEAHYIYNRASAVIAPPGSAGDGNSFGEKLASAVAARVHKEYIPSFGAERQPQKEGLRQDLTATFTVSAPLQGTVIVIDDVYRSGATMQGAAAAARRAGAERVVTLTAARTVRN